jgi:branched-chain amino acid transport system ATP-binding protein
MLAVKNLEVSYGAIKAVHGISFHLDEGEMVALIGNNGAGKTSTLKAITGIITNVRGSIEFEDEKIGGMPSDKIAARKMAMVPEGRHIFSGMTVQENLDIGAFLRRDADGIKKDMQMVYDLFPVLRERSKQQGGTLSGGEQQMLAIGRALMARPKILLLDEPSLGLAPIVVEAIFESIMGINRQGIPILIVEQNVYLALSVTKRGYVMESGQIVLEGSSQELLASEMVQRVYLGVEEAG